MQILDALSIVVVASAAVAYINYRFIKLAPAVGIMLFSILSAGVVLGLGVPYPAVLTETQKILTQLDFSPFFMNGLLAFLLFAGSMQIDLNDLKNERLPIFILAIFSTVLSTALVAVGLYDLSAFLGQPIAFNACLVFGALISPTDPVAVLAILRRVGLPRSLETKISGESLFNDGIGIVLFLLFSPALALDAVQGEGLDWAALGMGFLREAGGGLLLGGIAGYLALRLASPIHHFQTEILLTVAMVMGSYTLASHIHVSGALAMVVAGIVVGNQRESIVDQSREYLEKFWELIDEAANAILFLLIGLEVILIRVTGAHMVLGLLVVVLVLAARYASVWLPLRFLSLRLRLERGAIPILTWGGLRGGIPVALALSLPDVPAKEPLVTITYVVVVFSIAVQGLTIGKLAQRYAPKEDRADALA